MEQSSIDLGQASVFVPPRDYEARLERPTQLPGAERSPAHIATQVDIEKMIRRIDKHTASQLSRFIGKPVPNFNFVRRSS